MLALIEELTTLTGVSGHEQQVRDAIRRRLEGRVDAHRVDPLGNLLAYRGASAAGRGAGLRVLLAAHMDEVGIMVRKIDDRGYIRFSTIGSLAPQTLLAQRVVFTSGTVGVIGAERLDDMGRLALEHLYVDVGAANREEALARVEIGETASFCPSFHVRGDQVVAKALDDRIGCAVLLDCLAQLPDDSFGHELCFAFTSQEEVGVRGAQVAAQSFRPDFAIVVDVTPTGDTPKGLDYETRLGGGAAIKIMDKIPGMMTGFLAPPGVTRFVRSIAEEEGIPWQPEVLERGSTDAASIHLVGEGILTAVISVPFRYSHSPNEVIHLADARAARDLILGILSRLDRAALEEMLA